ncbi:molybdenum cofactor biosynthesis protein [Deltaproteobacteria bacterium]|nr:molybdenum cofactor biosynthesis protein [Deltaproteobacteria bacterium]
MPTAGIVIIGNELLTGKFADENTPWLVQRLRTLGCDLQRVAIVIDTVEAIAEEVAMQSSRFDWVFTTGGVGPTHDDVTFEGVAAAFGAGVAHHPVLVSILQRRLGERCNTAALRMALVPEGAELWWDGDVIYPLTVMRNVCIFPGVPSLLKLKFDKVAHRFAGVPVSTARLVTLRTEPEIADALTAAAGRWPAVAIGSYPRLEETPMVVIVTLESRDDAALAECGAFLRGAGLDLA